MWDEETETRDARGETMDYGRRVERLRRLMVKAERCLDATWTRGDDHEQVMSNAIAWKRYGRIVRELRVANDVYTAVLVERYMSKKGA